MVSASDLESALDRVRANAAGPVAGVFGPDTVTWRIDREAVIFLGAGRALLMQLAHPWVAAAIAEHSKTFADPIGRFHRTFGLELNPWFLNTGFGFDFANEYRNYMVSVGVDIVRTLRVLEIIPKNPMPAKNGYFPHPLVVSSVGLPDNMTPESSKPVGAPKAPTVSEVAEIIKNIPGRIYDKTLGSPEKVKLEPRMMRSRFE